MPLNNFTSEEFLQHYWQQKPLLIRNALPGFQDPISPEELAGLSLEEEIDSRIIISKPDWQQKSGPFSETDFESLPESDWTLLVQSVETWLPELQDILKQFAFIPKWRLDDLMISYAVPGGTVGPHLDQYDVFLLQGSGQRHWQVGQPNQPVKEYIPHPMIRQVEAFEPIIDDILEPGDLLYIPPNTPHFGVATENCLTYSIGFRAPSQQNLLEQLLIDLLGKDETNSQRYKNSPQLFHHPAQQQKLPADIIDWSRSAVDKISNEQLVTSFGKLVTRLKHDIVLDDEPNLDEVKQHLQNIDADLMTHSDTRLTFYTINEKQLLFMNGDCFTLSAKHSEWIEYLCETGVLSNSFIKKLVQDIDFTNTIAILVNKGWLLFKQ